ncbi:MAG: NAD(P)H-dependent glycerol-3-phosphate dehydrogenase, partial [Candidatus Geothermincolales bacterium]
AQVLDMEDALRPCDATVSSALGRWRLGRLGAAPPVAPAEVLQELSGPGALLEAFEHWCREVGITRLLGYRARFGAALGANPITFSGLSGVGDLIVTCISRHSRNRGFGERLGRGERAEDVLGGSRMVVEGVFAARIAVEMSAELGVEVPIAQVVHQVIQGEVHPREAVTLLMTRRLREETDEEIYRAFLLGQRGR